MEGLEAMYLHSARDEEWEEEKPWLQQIKQGEINHIAGGNWKNTMNFHTS